MISNLLKKSCLNNILSNAFATSLTHKLAKSKTCMLDGYEVPTQTTVNKETMLKLFKEMTLVRKVELQLEAFYKDKVARGFVHLYLGQESVAIGVENGADRLNDIMSCGYRCHAQCLTRGISPAKIFAEVIGREYGQQKGHGGSGHFYNPKNNFMGGHGIVGAYVSTGVGNAFALHYNGNPGKNVALTFYGDGSANQGQWFESVNMAKLWNLPCLLICENNRYGFGTPIKEASANNSFYNRGAGLLVPGFDIDGHDVLHVMEATKWAKDYVLKNGPIIMECHTYRYSGHSVADPGTQYRTREEVNEVRKTKDPIMKLEKLMIQNKIATKEELKAIEKKIKKECDEAAKFAVKQPFPPLSQSKQMVYIDNDKHFIQGCTFEDSQFPEGRNF